MGEVKLRIPPDLSVDAALAAKAEHVDAFRTGNPFSMMRGRWEVDIRRSQPRNVVYHDGRIAWIDSQFDALHVENLEFGQETSYTNPNREKSTSVCLTSDIVAVTTASGKCYAWDLPTPGAPSSIQLPSAQVNRLIGSGKALAIVHRNQTASELCITTWTLGHGTTRSFDIALRGNRHKAGYTIHLTPDWLLLLERVPGPPDQIFFSRYTLDGTIIAKGASGLLNRNFRSGYVKFIVHPQQGPTKTVALEELDTIRIQDENTSGGRYLRKRAVEETRGVIKLVYDLRNDRLQTTQLDVLDAPEGPMCPMYKMETYCFFWKDIVFGFRSDDMGRPDGRRSFAFDMYNHSAIKDYRYRLEYDMQGVRIGEGWRRNMREPPDFTGQPGDKPIWFLGDETYLVRVYPNGFTAFCFDKNIKMANEDESFRDLREVYRLERIHRLSHPDSKIHERGQGEISELLTQLADHERNVWGLGKDGEQEGQVSEGHE